MPAELATCAELDICFERHQTCLVGTTDIGAGSERFGTGEGEVLESCDTVSVPALWRTSFSSGMLVYLEHLDNPIINARITHLEAL